VHSRIDHDRTDRPDRVTLAEKIETNDPSVAEFGHHPKHHWVPDETADALPSSIHGWEIRRKPVALMDGSKSLVADATALISISIQCRADHDVLRRLRHLRLKVQWQNSSALGQ
jgi:hypothetical protein